MPAWDLRLDLTSLLTKISRAEFLRSACGTKTGGHYCMGRRGVYFPAKQDAGTQTRYWSHACMLPAVLLPPSRCPTDSMHQHLLPCPQPAATASMSPTCGAAPRGPRPCAHAPPSGFVRRQVPGGQKGNIRGSQEKGGGRGGNGREGRKGRSVALQVSYFPPCFPRLFPSVSGV